MSSADSPLRINSRESFHTARDIDADADSFHSAIGGETATAETTLQNLNNGTKFTQGYNQGEYSYNPPKGNKSKKPFNGSNMKKK